MISKTQQTKRATRIILTDFSEARIMTTKRITDDMLIVIFKKLSTNKKRFRTYRQIFRFYSDESVICSELTRARKENDDD